MRVLVTGGAGFIGRHLTEKLRQKKNVELALLVHNTDVKSDVKKYYGNINYRESLIPSFLDFQPEVIFHLAAQPIVRNSFINRELDYETIQTNMLGTQNVFDVAMKCKSLRKIIHVSTDKVFGDVDFIQQTSCLLGTKHPYNASKLAGDVLAQMFASYYSVPTVIVRHGNIYGDGDLHWDRIVPRTIRQIHRNCPPVIRGDGKNNRDYIHVDDIIDAYLKLLDFKFSGNPFVVHFGAENPHTTQYIVDSILELMGRIDLPIHYEPQWVGEIPNQHIDSFANGMLGWSPKVDIDDGLERTVTWYKEYLEKKND